MQIGYKSANIYLTKTTNNREKSMSQPFEPNTNTTTYVADAPGFAFQIEIPESFPVTTLKGVVTLDSRKRVILTARTREGKTLLALLLGCSIKEIDPDTIVILVSPNLTAAIDDLEGKMDYFPELQETGVDLLSYKDNKVTFAEEFMNPEADRLFMMNADYTYVDKLVDYATRTSNKIVILLDEAHKGGAKTYERILSEVATLDNVAIIETTATFRNRVLTRPHGDVVRLIPRSAYRSPTAAHLIPVSIEDNAFCREHQQLCDSHLDEIVRECDNNSCLIMINGGGEQAYHWNAKRQIKDSLVDLGDEIAIIQITGGNAKWSDLLEDAEHTIRHQRSKKAIRDASSIIKTVYNKGYRKIVVVGQKQVAEGQTIGFAGFPLTLQIMHTALGKQQADSIAQWIRTGGIGVDVTQKIMMVQEKWEDYLAYIDCNEDLRDTFEGLDPVEQQKAAESMYLKLETLHVKNGDYTPTPVMPDISSLPLLTDYHEYPLEDSWKEQLTFNAEVIRTTKDLRKWIATEIKELYPDETFPCNMRTIAGDINTKKSNGGNDISVYVHQDPNAKSQQAWQRNITVWMRDDKLCIRVRKSAEPTIGLVHNYWGKPACFVKDLPGSGMILT